MDDRVCVDKTDLLELIVAYIAYYDDVFGYDVFGEDYNKCIKVHELIKKYNISKEDINKAMC